MDHDGAVASGAVERYLVGSMSEQERDAFEEHFFGCVDCAEHIRSGARFRANAREVMREGEAVAARPWPDRFRWILTPMMVACALLLVYQNLVEIPGLKRQLRGRSFPSFALRPAERAGAVAETRVPRGVADFAFYFDVPSGPGAPPEYMCTVTDAARKSVDSFTTPAPAGREPLYVMFHRADLSPGRYTLMVRGAPPSVGAPEFQFVFLLD